MKFRILGAWLLASFLVACGGGGGAEPVQVLAAASPLGDLKSATASKTTLDGRVRALAVTPPQAVVTVTTAQLEQFFAWVETTYPALFPKGPQTGRVTYLGVTYSVRSYVTGNAVGVTDVGDVYGLGPFTNNALQSYGNVSDYTCQMDPATCGGGTTTARPGTYRVDAATHVFLPNFVNGKATWLGASDGKSYDVAPGDIAAIRWNSNRRGWGAVSQASTAPQSDGSLVVTGVCNNDRGLPTIITKDNKELWPDFSAQGYQLTGEATPRMSFGMIEYGNYQPAQVSVVRETDNTVTLVVDFASNCAYGFGKANATTALDAAQPLMFMWQSNKAGAGRQPGWGLDTVAPSIRQAYFDAAEAKKNHLVLKFPNMACSDRGGVTGYKAKSISDDGKTVVYDPTPDGFGAGWLIVPKKDDQNPIWQAGAGVTFDPDKFQIAWDMPLCKE